jgi:hypothetical protein
LLDQKSGLETKEPAIDMAEPSRDPVQARAKSGIRNPKSETNPD